MLSMGYGLWACANLIFFINECLSSSLMILSNRAVRDCIRIVLLWTLLKALISISLSIFFQCCSMHSLMNLIFL